MRFPSQGYFGKDPRGWSMRLTHCDFVHAVCIRISDPPGGERVFGTSDDALHAFRTDG